MNISDVLQEIGLTRVATACEVSKSSVHKWKSRNQLPRTEWTGETQYARKIADLHGTIRPEDLLTR